MVTFSKKSNLLFRQNLLLSISFNEYFENDWPENLLLNSYNELEQILDFADSNTFRFLFFNSKKIESILLEEQEILELDKFELNLKLFHNLFYLDLLLLNNDEIINYKCSLDFIKKVNSFIKSNNNSENLIQNIIFLKAIIDLIKSYRQIDEYNEDIENKELKEMEEQKEIKKMINGKLKNLNIKLKENDILSKNIDEIYGEIIISWLKLEEFEEIDSRIINQLFLEHIYLTKNMFNKICNFFENERNIKKFMIETIEDLSDHKKINFHYILLKYILKVSFFIYQIPFFNKTRNIILKSNLNELLSLINNKDSEIQKRIEYIILKLIDSEYYQHNYYKQQLTDILLYYKQFLFETKKDDIKLIENFINDKQYKKIDNYLKDYEIAKKMNFRFPIIKYLNNIPFKTETETELNIYIDIWEKYEIIIKEKKYTNIDKDTKKKLVEYFNNENNKNILLNIFTEEEYTSFIENNSQHLKENSSSRVSNSDNSTSVNSYYKKNSGEEELSKIKSKSSELEVLEFIKIIGENQTQFIQKLNNNYYISGGKDELLLYNSLYKFQIKIDLDRGITSYNNIYEINSDSSKIKFAILCKSIYYVVTINLNNFSSKIKQYQSEDLALQTIFSIPSIENKYIITGNNGIWIITNNFDSQISEKKQIKENPPFIGGINIDNNTLALTSNSIIPNGEDKLILYNKFTNTIKKEIIGHSFRISSNGLSLLENEKDDKKTKILLCACKKYSKEQKNGILLVDLSKFEQTGKINELFYETDHFEVDCFCPISIVENKNSSSEEITKKENIAIKKTDFFFVGGFDEQKREGIIKIYKINYNNNKIDIEFIQDIINNDRNNSNNRSNSSDSNDKPFEGFGRSITSIIQSNIMGNILVTSLDGNVYLFKPPNIDYFLNNDYL